MYDYHVDDGPEDYINDDTNDQQFHPGGRIQLPEPAENSEEEGILHGRRGRSSGKEENATKVWCQKKKDKRKMIGGKVFQKGVGIEECWLGLGVIYLGRGSHF